MGNRQLVLGAVRGYPYERLAPFVNSLRATGYAGDVVFLDFGALAGDTRERLAAAGVELAPVPDPRLLDESVLHVSSARYLAYAELLRTRGGAWDRVLLTDVRDVVFQADPFAADLGPSLACFLEDERKTIATERYNANWIVEVYGRDVLDELGRFPICCSGTTAGATAAVGRYLEQLSEAILARRARGPLCIGADQGIHNYLLWKRRLDDVTVFPNGRGNVLTVGILPPEDLRFDAAGRLRNADGTLPAIVHQYDRHPVLSALLDARHAGADAAGAPARQEADAPAAAPGTFAAPPPAPSAPRLSVVVPTFGRPERIRTLIDRLDRQTLPPDEFEVIVVDDGSPVPIALDPVRHAFPLTVLRQENAGPAAARNRGVETSRADLVLFLNDDAVPREDLFAAHLRAHAEHGAPVAVLGTFEFTKSALREPFTRLLAGSDLLFDFPGLKPGALHGWQFFWTCNLSLPRRALLDAGGFDAVTFKEAIVEDVELGYRLEQRGIGVLHRPDAVCEHEHALTIRDYTRRATRLGVNLVKFARKHGNHRLMYFPREKSLPDIARDLQARCEEHHLDAEAFFDTVERWSELMRDRVIPEAQKPGLREDLKSYIAVPCWRGMLVELTGTDPGRIVSEGPPRGKLTSILVCSHDALEKTKRCVEALRRTADPAFPAELLFVDNASTDGSAEWLAAQPDLRVVLNAENVGAPRARNQLLPLAKGDYVVFMDNDVVVTPGWLERMIFHAEVAPWTGCVGACADRASHGQQVDYEGPKDPESLARFSGRHAAAHHRKGRSTLLLASFCLLVKREVLAKVGGFDERFSPWGFEDDDYTLRACLAGHPSRVALDVFVHHDTYGGAKGERHQRLLLRNWGLFAEKWGLGDVPYGDFTNFHRTTGKRWTRDELFVAV